MLHLLLLATLCCTPVVLEDPSTHPPSADLIVAYHPLSPDSHLVLQLQDKLLWHRTQRCAVWRDLEPCTTTQVAPPFALFHVHRDAMFKCCR